MALFEQALKMLSPYGRDGQEEKPAGGEPAPTAEAEDPRLRRLEAQIEALREQLDSLGRNRQE
jgi:hypothetical protein